MAGELHELSANELVNLYKERKVSPVEVATSLLKRIETLQPTFNPFCVLDPERTLKEANK